MYLNIKKCILYEDNKIKSLTEALDLDEYGEVQWSETGFVPFISIRKQLEKRDLYLWEIDRFFDITFKQVNYDWTIP